MGSALWVAQMMHDALTIAGVNAWHFWWLFPNGGTSDNSALWDGSHQPTKRLYAMGNFSKFVRPGFHRVSTTTDTSNPLSVSAYYDSPGSTPPSGQLVVVAVNATGCDVPQSFFFDGVSTSSWKAWVTSATSDVLTPAAAPALSGGALAYTLPAQSVTTLQGTITGVGPAAPQAPSATTVCAKSPSAAQQPTGSVEKSSGLACATAPRASRNAGASGSLAGAAGWLALLGLRRRRR